MPGDGVTDVAPLAQSQQTGVPGLPPGLSGLYTNGWGQMGWVQPVTAPAISSHVGSFSAQSAQQRLLTAAPRMTIMHTAWQPQDGWMFPQQIGFPLAQQWAIHATTTAQQMLLRGPGVLSLLSLAWHGQDGWRFVVARDTLSISWAPVTSGMAQFLSLPWAMRRSMPPMAAPVAQDGWVFLASLAALTTYLPTMFPAISGQAADASAGLLAQASMLARQNG